MEIMSIVFKNREWALPFRGWGRGGVLSFNDAEGTHCNAFLL